jgi:CRP-like cAMP-binding protein
VLGKLAKEMTREELPPGTVVIREGEEGDRFYVVFAGMLTVTNSAMGEREILRPGDYFGEVALAMDVPRTATVTAITDLRVLALDRSEFLVAATGAPDARTAADVLIVERLAQHPVT